MCLSIYLSTVFIYLSIHLHVLSIYLSVSLYMYVSNYLCIYLSINLSIYSSIHVLITSKSRSRYLPSFSLFGLMSMAMMREAPLALHPISTASPTAPTPHTAQLDPASTWRENRRKKSSLKPKYCFGKE